MDNQSLSHVHWKCQYHIVFILKYRKKVLYGKLGNDVREVIPILCKYKDVQIIDGAVCEDHMLQSKWDKSFWARRYYVSTIGNIT